jgi:hypothetical protein
MDGDSREKFPHVTGPNTGWAGRLIPPGDQVSNMRASKGFQNLEILWELSVFGCFFAGIAVALWGLGPPALARFLFLVFATFQLEHLIWTVLWGKSPFRILSYYFRSWMEEKDSPRFWAHATLCGHSRSVRAVLLSHLFLCLAVFSVSLSFFLEELGDTDWYWLPLEFTPILLYLVFRVSRTRGKQFWGG